MSLSSGKTNMTKGLVVVYKVGYRFRWTLAVILFSYSFDSSGQQIEVIKADQLFHMIDQCPEKNKLHVYNFWATWCAPRVREIPHFESLNNSDRNVNVTLISIDDVDLLEKKVIPFVKRKEIKSNVVLLDETDFNEIIDKIDKSWSGAIPASLIVDCRSGKRLFYEKEFKAGELEKAIEMIINHP